jgi:hypothetical protein
MDRPSEPLVTRSLTLRRSDVGLLHRLGNGNLSLGLRRLIDQTQVDDPAGPERS